MFTSPKTMIAFTYAYNQSEVQYPTDTTIIGFAVKGAELYAHQFLTDKLMVLT